MIRPFLFINYKSSAFYITLADSNQEAIYIVLITIFLMLITLVNQTDLEIT
jgi:hypothetical protein